MKAGCFSRILGFFRICGTTLQIHLDHSDPIDNCIINYRKILLLNTIHCTDISKQGAKLPPQFGNYGPPPFLQ